MYQLIAPQDLTDRLLDLAFSEDIGDGDHTTLSCIPADAMGQSHLLIKESGILAGIEVAREVFHRFDPDLRMEVYIGDGAAVKPGDIPMKVSGRVQSLLQTERLMLNIMQRMSGIATMTRRYVNAVAGTKTRILDTRKTTPGMRMLEKEAVRIGGGTNHRIGLFDMILLKDNHVDFAGGITAAIDRARAYCAEKGKDLKIEIEVRSLEDIDEVFAAFAAHFGYYPQVAGSWLLDAHSIAYMSEQYHVKAFCICREQYAVDAYTLWGGYYSGGYYPSKNNMLCPASRAENTISTPVFRMLGIDPIYGYDEQTNHAGFEQGCCTMEPVWSSGNTVFTVSITSYLRSTRLRG